MTEILMAKLTDVQSVEADVSALATTVSDHIANESEGVHGATAVGIAVFQAVDAAAGRDALELGTAATKNIQASPTDATAGRLLTVGAFGLGTDGIIPENIDNIERNGFYRISASFTTGTYPSGVGGGSGDTLIHQTWNIDFATQQWYRHSVDKMFIRRKQSGNWSSWVEIINTDNMVGSDGVVNTGSNSNGDWTRFADGTQIVTKSFNLGNYNAGVVGSVSMTFAIAFSSDVTIQVNVNSSTPDLYNVSAHSRTTTGCQIAFWNNAPGTVNRQVSVTVVGRWS